MVAQIASSKERIGENRLQSVQTTRSQAEDTAKQIRDVEFQLNDAMPKLLAAQDQLARATASIDVDLNGAGDSPAVLLDGEELMSTVNFDTTATALAFEGLGLALSHCAAIGVFRIAKLMSHGFTGLPRPFLVCGGGGAGSSCT